MTENDAPKKGELTELIGRANGGDAEARQRLFECLYHELRGLARSLMKSERLDHTLEPTALVNEAYLRLARGEHLAVADRHHFVGVAARAMRQVLVDHARGVGRAKRGGDWERQPLSRVGGTDEPNWDVLELHEALDALADYDPRKARVVELRTFAGLEHDEIATILRLDERTVRRDWIFAQAWLARHLGTGDSA